MSDTHDPVPEAPVARTPLDHTPPPGSPSFGVKLAAEALGTFLLVFGGVGSALLAANFGISDNGTSLGIGFVGVSLAFGLTVVAGAYAFGPISGGHFNPAVTLGVAAAGRFPWRDTWGYIIAQIVGGIVAASALALIGVFGPAGWLDAAMAGGFASNGFGDQSPGGFGLGAAITIELILTAIFLFVILGTTHSTLGTKFAGLTIGLTLTLIHLISIPVTNTSVNPARSIAPAIFGGVDPLSQLWVFIVFPILGALIAGWIYRALFEGRPTDALPPAR